MAVNSSKDVWLEALCAGAVNSQVLLKKNMFLHSKILQILFPNEGKRRRTTHSKFFLLVLGFAILFFILTILPVWVKETNRPLKYQTSSRLHILTQKWYKRSSVNVLTLHHTGILVLFPEVKYLLPPCSAYFCFRKLMLTRTMFSPICCHYWINEKWQNYTSGSFES